jgi:hypothetical protein
MGLRELSGRYYLMREKRGKVRREVGGKVEVVGRTIRTRSMRGEFALRPGALFVRSPALINIDTV